MSMNSQIELITSMVNSINELKNVLLLQVDVDAQLLNSIQEILIVLKKAVERIPAVLMSADGEYIPKERLLGAYSLALNKFNGYPNMNKEFALYWEDFAILWGNYSTQMHDVENSKTAVFISLN